MREARRASGEKTSKWGERSPRLLLTLEIQKYTIISIISKEREFENVRKSKRVGREGGWVCLRVFLAMKSEGNPHG
jgi:hypothetical protein